MISFRYHLVSIAAVLLALAAGVALGAGPLSDSNRIVGQSNADSKTSTASLGELQSFESAYANKTGKALTTNKLKGTSVVFITLPGAQADQVKNLEKTFGDAGSLVVGRIALQNQLVDSKGRQFAEGVAGQATKGVNGVATEGESYTRIGSALARAFVAKKTANRDSASSTIGSAFAQGKLIDIEKKPTKVAEMAVFVAGPDKLDSDLGQGSIVVAMAEAFDQTAKGTLIAGPSASGDDGGYLEAIRASDVGAKVSSIDVIDSAAGRLVATLVAARELGGNAGAFGTSRSADGAIPN